MEDLEGRREGGFRKKEGRFGMKEVLEGRLEANLGDLLSLLILLFER